MTAVSLTDAALQLGISPSTLRRYLRAGAPSVRTGSRGRGRATMVDADAIRQWLDACPGERDLLELRSRLPEVLAQAALDAHTLAPDKRNGAWIACAVWQSAVDSLGLDVDALPAPIKRLRKIATL